MEAMEDDDVGKCSPLSSFTVLPPGQMLLKNDLIVLKHINERIMNSCCSRVALFESLILFKRSFMEDIL